MNIVVMFCISSFLLLFISNFSSSIFFPIYFFFLCVVFVLPLFVFPILFIYFCIHLHIKLNFVFSISFSLKTFFTVSFFTDIASTLLKLSFLSSFLFHSSSLQISPFSSCSIHTFFFLAPFSVFPSLLSFSPFELIKLLFTYIVHIVSLPSFSTLFTSSFIHFIH